jgi:hypothetical protein
MQDLPGRGKRGKTSSDASSSTVAITSHGFLLFLHFSFMFSLLFFQLCASCKGRGKQGELFNMHCPLM